MQYNLTLGEPPDGDLLLEKLALYLLGTPRLERDGASIEFDTRKAMALLAYLAVTGEVHGRDTLATLFWADSDQSSARAALRRTLSVLKDGLGDDVLDVHRETLGTLPSAPIWVDVTSFNHLLAESRSHAHAEGEACPRCLARLEQAAALYRGDFMAGFTLRDSPQFDDWQFFQSESLRRDLASALERLSQGLAAQGKYEDAIVHARRRLALDPLHEPAHRQLMLLYSWGGQAAAALRQYQECTRILEVELGVEPMQETDQLYEAIKEHRLPPPALPAPAPTPSRADENLPPKGLPLVGRREELAALESRYAGMGAGGYFMVIEGEAGIGKTRLAEEFLRRRIASGAAALTASCYSGEAYLAYAPFIEALQSAFKIASRPNWRASLEEGSLVEAGRLLPGLAHSISPTAALPASPGAQMRFYEGVGQVLRAACGESPPGILFLDDLQWADEASLDLLTYLVRRRHLFLLVTWRGEDLPPDHRLRLLLAEAQRNHLGSAIHLSRLDARAVQELVDSVAAGSGAALESLGQRLFEETEGLPFFIAEYLAVLPAGETDQGSAWAIPQGVRDILHSRLESVGETGRQLLQAAAVIGRSFDYDTLQEASGRSEEETATTLEALVGRGLIRERQAGGELIRRLEYDFSHDKVRSLVYAEMGQARRRILHQRVADVLLRHTRGQKDAFHTRGYKDQHAIAGQLAYHFRQAGRAKEAAEYSRLAGEHARSLFANAEALGHFQVALALGYPDFIGLEQAIGDLYTLQGDYQAALTSYTSAVEQEGASPQVIARLRQRMGNVFHRQGEWEQAERCFQLASQDLTEGDLSRLYADWSRTARRAGQVERALRMAAQALELAEQAGDDPALAQAHNILGMLLRIPQGPGTAINSRADEGKAIQHLEVSLRLAEKLSDPGARIAALNNLSLAYAEHGELERALERALQALDLCTRLGDRHRQAALHSNLADLYHAAGMEAQSMAHQKQAVVIFSEIGASEADRPRPEIWKLTEW